MAKTYITGVPGVGKSTIAARLKKEGFHVYDVDEVDGLCNWKHKETGEFAKHTEPSDRNWLDKYNWICDVQKLKDLIKKTSNIIVFGITSNQREFMCLFDKVILLNCNKKTFLKRLSSRVGNDFGKKEFEKKHILSWYKNFEKDMLKRGAISISTESNLEQVIEEIKKVLV